MDKMMKSLREAKTIEEIDTTNSNYIKFINQLDENIGFFHNVEDNPDGYYIGDQGNITDGDIVMMNPDKTYSLLAKSANQVTFTYLKKDMETLATQASQVKAVRVEILLSDPQGIISSTLPMRSLAYCRVVQPESNTWARTFGGINHDYALSVQQTNDGGYIITGYTGSFGSGYSDVYLIKTDSGGNEEWSKTFGGIKYDSAHSVQQTNDDGYIIAATTSSFGSGARDVYLIKTDSGGNEEWSKTFGGISHDYGCSIQQTRDGGYIITGYTFSFGAGGIDAYLIKTDASGNCPEAGSPVHDPAEPD
jgi:hypothetical protein